MKNTWLAAIADWTISGNVFSRTGYPFTVIDSSTSVLATENFHLVPGVNTQTFANQVIPGSFSCGASAAGRGGISNPCGIMTTAYQSIPTDSAGNLLAGTWGNQRRNQIYGPSYINTNLTLMKNFQFPRWESGKVGVGVQFFNILNHPNFDQPVNDLANPLFGTIQHTVNTPTSMYGSFLGADASARQIQLRATLNF